MVASLLTSRLGLNRLTTNASEHCALVASEQILAIVYGEA